MNRKERAVLFLLIATFVAGSIVAYVKKSRLALLRNRSPVVLVGSDRPACTGAATSLRVDLNLATEGELEALPGIGPVLAARIVAYRQRSGGFRNVGELRRVAGIGPRRLLALADLVEAREMPDPSAQD